MFAYGLLAAWGILPNMMEEYKRTRAAFAARGIRVFPVSPALLKPLLVKSVRWSEELSIAMESRGFDGRVPARAASPCACGWWTSSSPILSCALFLALFFLLGR
ncbi:MAG: energy-coupling factor transporter transmembrane component T [Flavonifractor plautii]